MIDFYDSRWCAKDVTETFKNRYYIQVNLIFRLRDCDFVYNTFPLRETQVGYRSILEQYMNETFRD